jgi:hypothetical protein
MRRTYSDTGSAKPNQLFCLGEADA